MIKVSFNNESKKVQTFNNKVVVVTLKGILKVPNKTAYLAFKNIEEWAEQHPSVKLSWLWNNSDIVTQGKATCSDTDDFDVKKGERIAESRAKIKLYRFLCTLIRKIIHQTYDVIYGNNEVTIVNPSHTESPKPCLRGELIKYKRLLENEQQHLAKILNET